MKYLSILFLSALPLAAQDKSVDPEATRELIRQWVQTERILSEEKTTWQVEKKRMQDLLDIYQKELKLLDEELSRVGGSARLVDENKQKLEKELKEYREAQRLLSDAMARLLPRVRALIVRLPEPLTDGVSADVEFLKSPEALGKPRDVLKSMIAILTASGQFNRAITIAEQTREVTGKGKMTVKVVYLGLCRAYYTTASGDTAGIGIPGKNGWIWKAKPGIADEIRRAIAIYQKDKQPQLVKLPVQLSGTNEEE